MTVSEENIRVLIVGPHPPPTGGIATVVSNILCIEFGPQISTRLFDLHQFPRPRGILFRAINAISNKIPPTGVWTVLTFFLTRAFRRALEAERTGVVHIHASHGYGFWSAARLIHIAKQRGLRVIFHSHGSRMDVFYDRLSAPAQAYYRHCLRQTDLCIALSEAWYTWFSQFVQPEHLDVVPNCIDWRHFQRGNDGRAGIPPRILFIGVMFGRRKGIHDLIAVAPKILETHPDARFVLVGSDDEDVEANLEIDERTRAALDFTGDLNPDEVANAYAEATCFVLPAYHEGMPMVMLEAMAAGLPVICTAINAIPEVIEHDVNGLLIEPGDQSALAGHILDLLSDGPLRERLGEAARSHIEEHHNLARQEAWLSDIYRRVARGEGSRRS